MRSQKVPETGVVPSGTAAVADERAALRVWVGFIAMSIGMFMAVLDIQIVASSLPELQAALLIPLDRLSWVQTAYLSAEIVAIPLTGWMNPGFDPARHSRYASSASPASARCVLRRTGSGRWCHPGSYRGSLAGF
jgi:MFS family permease